MSTHSYRGRDLLCDLTQYPKLVTVHPILAYAKNSFCEVPPVLSSSLKLFAQRESLGVERVLAFAGSGQGNLVVKQTKREGCDMFKPPTKQAKNPNTAVQESSNKMLTSTIHT